MKEYGRIRMVDSYVDAPKCAYIIREMGDFTVRLEHYDSDQMDILKEYPTGSFDHKCFEKTLVDARKLMGCNKTLWVERPSFFY